MITITPTAKRKIIELRGADERPDLALRMGIRGRGVGGFLYDLQFVGQAEKQPSDIVVDQGEFQVFIDPESAPHLQGVKLDYVQTDDESGFDFENPNALWTDPLAIAVQKVIDERVNPALASHGGRVGLVEVKDNTAYVALGGGCQGCGMARVTLKQGVEVMIREAIPQIERVVDATNHAAGMNPYY